jgi:ribitol-5-phosphate 2-dehydrogenase (NADP+)
MRINNIQLKLIKPLTFKRVESTIVPSKKHILVKPTLVSICKSDLRYYSGNRPREILKKKLPLVLIHEGIGIVQENKNGFKKGDSVIIIPLISKRDSNNYDPKNLFLSSTKDGLLQNYIALPTENLIKIPSYLSKQEAVLCELVSVACHAQTRVNIKKYDKIAILGDGPLGKIVYFVMKQIYRQNIVDIYDKKKEIRKNYDVIFECVGKYNAKSAIDDALNALNHNGYLVLMGVSEMEIPIKTRTIIDKGITIIGSNRSNHNNFRTAFALFMDKKFSKQINSVIRNKPYEITKVNDLKKSFDYLLKKKFKKKLLLDLNIM